MCMFVCGEGSEGITMCVVMLLVRKVLFTVLFKIPFRDTVGIVSARNRFSQYLNNGVAFLC